MPISILEKQDFIDKLENYFDILKAYCEAEDFKGWDIFDGLNSKLLPYLPFSKSRFLRLMWIQLFKRNPINLRHLALVPKGENPQGLALFLSGYCNLYYIAPSESNLYYINYLTDRLLDLQSKGWSGSCWGYNFEWQARAFYQPKYAPTVVASTFVGYALLDAFAITQKHELLATARSIADFILKDLHRTPIGEKKYIFSYSPSDKTLIFNASLLGSKMLARLYSHTGESFLLEEAEKSVAACCSYQQDSGAWSYGTKPYHYWVDNFHTGYNLEAIAEYQKYSGDTKYQVYLSKGLDYYIKHLFLPNGLAKWYDTRIYPVDSNSPAQCVITLYRLQKLEIYSDFVKRVWKWTFEHMRDKKGYFYFQVHKYYTNKIPFMRWSQAWIFNAMTFYLRHCKAK